MRVFRWRVAWIGAVFGAEIATGAIAQAYAPALVTDLAGIASLPADHLATSPGRVGASPLYLLPAALVLGSYALRAWGTSYLSFRVMKDSRVHDERLVVAGPFAFVRNPLYVGNVLLAAAVGLVVAPPGLLVGVAGMTALGAAIARVEERRLALAHPEYADYAANVPRFLPRLTPYRPTWARPARPRARDGILGEGWHLALAAAFATMATPAHACAPAVGAAAAAAWIVAALAARRTHSP